MRSSGCNKAIIYDRFRFLHPITKRKGYSQNESPIVKMKALAIILLCTHRGEWVHFLHSIFQCEFVPGVAEKETCRNHSYSRVHLPFCIRNLQEHKEKDWNLVSKFQSFYVKWLKKWYNSRLSFCNSPFVLHWVHLGAEISSWVQIRLSGCNLWAGKSNHLSHCIVLLIFQSPVFPRRSRAHDCRQCGR